MTPKFIDIARLVALGLIVSALMMAHFRAGVKALNPLSGFQLWPKESRWQFFVGLVLLGIVELVNWVA